MSPSTSFTRIALRQNSIIKSLLCSRSISYIAPSSSSNVAGRCFTTQSFRCSNCDVSSFTTTITSSQQQQRRCQSSDTTKTKNNETEDTGPDVTISHEYDDSGGDGGPDKGTKTHEFPEGFDTSKFTVEVKIRMPDFGEQEARVAKWHKKEGDLIKHNDALCDIQMESFTFGMVADDECDALMGPILVPERTEECIDEGAVLCITYHPEE